ILYSIILSIRGDMMKASKKKIQIARARACISVLNIIEMSGLPRATVNRAVNGISVSPETLGKISKVLGVDVLEILADEQEE
ncbi:MAG: helix-turn-helix domain-containing protein, partial [Clostridia bacterium]|nr:helix-turn-helix domain-containing protein [Clostridia bacterium]